MSMINNILNLRIYGRASLSVRTAAFLLLIMLTSPAILKGVPMKKIPLSKNRGFALVDDEDHKKLSRHKWRLQKAKHTSYALTTIGKRPTRKTVLMHRLITKAPKGKQVDHRDKNGLNNQKYNLRVCTRSQNNMNRKKTRGTSKYKGVWLDRSTGKWRSHLNIDGRRIYLGSFSDEKDAGKAYDKAAKKHFKEFKNLNFPKQE